MIYPSMFLCTLNLYLLMNGMPQVAGVQLTTAVAHNDFMSRLNNGIIGQLEKGVEFAQNHLMRSNISELQLTTKQYSFLQIFYGLFSSEETYTNLFVESGLLIRDSDLPQMQTWLLNNFNFSSEGVRIALVNFVQWQVEESEQDTDVLSELMCYLAEHYSLIELLSQKNDVKTLLWLLKFESITERFNSKLLEEHWNKGNYEIVKTVLQKGGRRNQEDFIDDFSKSKNFISFLIEHEIVEALVYVANENLFDPINIVAQIIKENKMNIFIYFIQQSFNSTLDDMARLKEFLNVPIFAGQKTLLYESIENNNVEAQNIFLEAGADVNAVSHCNNSLLHTAVSAGKTAVVRELIKHKAKVNVKNCEGLTPIDIAASRNSSEILGLLLTSENHKTGVELMYKYFESNNSHAIYSFLEADVNINKALDCNKTLLHRAVSEGKAYIVKRVIFYGADMYAKDCYGMTPMHFAIMRDNQNMIALLAKEQFNISMTFNDGTSVLSFAAINGSIESIQKLIELGAEIDLIDKNNKTPLYEALLRNRTNVVQYLLNSGANINLKLSNGNSYLHSAVQLGSGNLVNELINKGIQIDKLNYNNETPLAVAVQRNRHVLVNVLLKNGANTSQVSLKGDSYLHLAVRNNSAEALQALLAHGMPPDSRGSAGDTAMWLAVQKDAVHLLEILKSFGGDVKQRNKWSYTLHHQAAYFGCSKSVEWLAKNDLSVNITDTFTKTTPLHLAAYTGHLRLVQVLLNLNACVDCKDVSGSTPLYSAEYYHHKEVAELIRSAGGTI